MFAQALPSLQNKYEGRMRQFVGEMTKNEGEEEKMAEDGEEQEMGQSKREITVKKMKVQ